MNEDIEANRGAAAPLLLRPDKQKSESVAVVFTYMVEMLVYIHVGKFLF